MSINKVYYLPAAVLCNLPESPNYDLPRIASGCGRLPFAKTSAGRNYSSRFLCMSCCFDARSHGRRNHGPCGRLPTRLRTGANRSDSVASRARSSRLLELILTNRSKEPRTKRVFERSKRWFLNAPAYCARRLASCAALILKTRLWRSAHRYDILFSTVSDSFLVVCFP